MSTIVPMRLKLLGILFIKVKMLSMRCQWKSIRHLCTHVVQDDVCNIFWLQGHPRPL